MGTVTSTDLCYVPHSLSLSFSLSVFLSLCLSCADQLASVIFNLSLSESVIPTCFKQTTIVHVPKNTKVTRLNDYRALALTSVATKCFESLVMAHINTIIPETLYPLQFAYRPNRSTDDAISIALPFSTWTKGTPM